MVTVEAICIGDELLEGRVRDANSAALGSFLSERGLMLQSARFVADATDEIVAALQASVADLVVVSGGLGPTTDDVTRDAAAAFSQSDLRLDEASLQWIKHRFAERGREMAAHNRRQAMVPDGSTVLATKVGTAPGFELRHGDRAFFFFPGVPAEYDWFVRTYLADRVPHRDDWARRLLQFHGLGESGLQARIEDIVDRAHADGVVVGYRAAYPVIEVKLAGDPDRVATTRDAVADRLREYLVAEDEEGLPRRLGRLLLERGETIATAESCTAGGIAALITEVGGSSGWFGRGYVTYANEAKVEELGVLESVLLQHGAVSAQTVCQMAAGARERARSTYAVAVSGIAGPGGGTAQKPVGTVHFGLATPHGTYHRHVRFHGGRRKVREGTAYTSLAMVLASLEGRGRTLGEAYGDESVWAESGIVPRGDD